MMLSNAQARFTKHILLNNLSGKHSLVMKFDQSIYYYKRIIFIKKFYGNCHLKNIPGPFIFAKN